VNKFPPIPAGIIPRKPKISPGTGQWPGDTNDYPHLNANVDFNKTQPKELNAK